MQIHVVWFVRKDGAAKAWKDTKVAGGRNHKPNGAFCRQRVHGQDFEGEAKCSKSCGGHPGDFGNPGLRSG